MNTVKTVTELQNRILELEVQVAEWRTMAEKDALTGCLRREFFDSLIDERRRFGLLPQNMTLALLDLDHFKRINDTYGHPAGDRVLEIVGQILRNSAPEGSLVCRMGGEEFVLLMPTEMEDSKKNLEKIRQAIQSHSLQINLTTHIRFTASFGFTTWNSDKSLLEATLKADEALYRAKKEGRNRIAA